MLKRFVSFLLVLSMLLASVPMMISVSADTVYTYTVNGFNKSRGENQLIIYTYNYADYTGTNAYGYEVVVTDGIVSSVGGNNSYIPNTSTSFVVSGHGTADDWLAQNVIVGMKVSYTRNGYSSSSTGTVTFTLDDSTYKYMLDKARNEALAARSAALDACLIYDSNADARFDAAEDVYTNTSTFTQASAQTLSDEYNAIASLYREREVSEYRGVWIRPSQTSTAQVNSYVRKLYDAGINLICLETMYAGTMIMPMPEDSLFEHNPKFNGFDVLKAYVDACHNYGMELHCWMPVFYTYSMSDANGTSYTLSPGYKMKDQGWLLTTNSGKVNYSNEAESDALVFLNPAVDAVQEFLLESYEYILEEYDIDGFQLDYIRYRDRYGDDDYGYDSTTISKFKQAYPRYNGYNITYNTNAYYWNDWVNFRASLVTDFVEKMRTLINKVAPEVTLSADVGASISTAKTTIYQDSTSWLQSGLLDMIHPMAYGEGMASYVSPYFNYAGDGCLVVPGLGTFMDEFDAEDMRKQTCEMTDIGCEGVIYFEASAFLAKNCGSLLTDTLFTEKSLAPSYNDTNTALKVMERFVERVTKASAAGKITSSLANQLINAANDATALAKTGANNALNSFKSIRSSLSSISSTAIGKRLLTDINIAIDAAYRDPGLDRDNSTLANGTIPSDAIGCTQLTIDKVNSMITGEDSVLITDINNTYTKGWENALLLKPVSGKTNVYTVIETYHGATDNIASAVIFDTILQSGMIIAAFHSDGLSEGADRYELAATVPVGAEIGIFGIDIATGTQLYKNSMIYVIGSGDNTELGPGSFGDSNPLWLTHYDNNTDEGSGSVFTVPMAANWWITFAFSPVGTSGVYEITQISNGLNTGKGATLDVPEGGFVYGINRGNNYSSSGGINYTSTNCNNAITDVLKWQVGDMLAFDGLDLVNCTVPTSTPSLKWYDPNYVCTATYRVFTPGESDVSEDVSDDVSEDTSVETSEDISADVSDEVSDEPTVIPDDLFWLTHYNVDTVEGAGVVFTETYTRGGWWLHMAFAPVAGTNAYELTAVSDGLSDGKATPLSVPNGGFVYCLNYGNDYPSIGDSSRPDYTNDAVDYMISVALQWSIGDKLVFDGLDLKNKTVPTTTSSLDWYSPYYVCTASWAEYVPTEDSDVSVDESSEDVSEESSDISGDGSSDESEAPDLGGYSLGDINADGWIDMYDYLMVKRSYFNTYNLDAYQRKRADIDKNNVVDVYDYVLIKRHYFRTYVIK